MARQWQRVGSIRPPSKLSRAQQKSGTPQRAAQVRIISKQQSPKTTSRYFFVKYSAFTGVKLCHFSGKSSKAKIAVTGQTGTHAPQSMHSAGLIKSCFTPSWSGSSLRGWIQSTGQTSTQAVSFVPMQGSAITYAIPDLLVLPGTGAPSITPRDRRKFACASAVLSFGGRSNGSDCTRRALLSQPRCVQIQ